MTFLAACRSYKKGWIILDDFSGFPLIEYPEVSLPLTGLVLLVAKLAGLLGLQVVRPRPVAIAVVILTVGVIYTTHITLGWLGL